MGVTGGYDALASTHSAQGGCSLHSQFPGMVGNEVGDLMAFEVTPHVFNRIEFRCIGWQALNLDPSLGGKDEVANQDTTVDGCPIPDHKYFGWNVPLEMFQELDHLQALDAAGMDLEVESPQGQGPDDREAFPIEGLLQDGCLSAGSPSASPSRAGAQSTFVNKDYGSTLLGGFFLMSGHLTRCHFAMALSSRSMARRSGRWQLKPLAPSNRQTCPG